MPQFATPQRPTDPFAEFESAEMEITPFGANAADARLFAGRLATHLSNDTLPEGVSRDEAVASLASTQEGIAQELDDVRTAFKGLSLDQARILENYMQDAPQLVRKRFEPGANWHMRLAYASDTQLINVLDWHTDELRRRQRNPEFQRNVDAHKRWYAAAFEGAVNDGWLHEDALEDVQNIGKIDYLVGDIFDTTMHGISGYHTSGTDYIVLGQNSGVDRHGRINQHLANHEAGHRFGWFGPRWLNEAVNDHIALALAKGRPEIVSPVQRQKDGGLYANERTLFGIVCEMGAEKIPASLFTRAFTAKGENKVKLVVELEDACERAWGDRKFIDAISGDIQRNETFMFGEREAGDPTWENVSDARIRKTAVEFEIEVLRNSIRERRQQDMQVA